MKNYIIASAFLISGSLSSGSVFAAQAETDQDFAFQHPARTQIVYRIERLKWLVDQRQKEGDFSKHQADALKAVAEGIHGEEILFADRNSGRVSAAQTRTLNAQLDRLAKEIGA